MAWPTPSTLPPERCCFCISIPDTPEWQAILGGALYPLTQVSNWKLDGAVTPQEAALFFDGAITMAGCQEALTDIRVSASGKLQRKVNGVWSDANGDGGDTTVYNSYTTLVTHTYPPPPPDTGLTLQVRSCGIAKGLTEYLYNRMLDICDAVDAVTDIVAALDPVLAIFPPLYALVDQINDALTEIVEATTETVRTLDTVNQRENTQCAIYCWLLSQPSLVTLENVGELKDVITGSQNIVLQAVWIPYLHFLEDAALVHRAMIYQNEGTGCDAICSDCAGEWQVTFDFTLDAYMSDWFYSTEGEWVPGVGHKTVLGNGNEQTVLYLVSTPSADFTLAEWTITNWIDGATQCSQLNELQRYADLVIIQTGALGNGVTVWNGAQVMNVLFVIRPGCNNSPIDPGGMAVISKVVLRGNGAYPFIHPPD